MPYTTKDTCPHGWYVTPGTLLASALFNSSTKCPKCRADQRAAEKAAKQERKEQAQRQAERTEARHYAEVARRMTPEQLASLSPHAREVAQSLISQLEAEEKAVNAEVVITDKDKAWAEYQWEHPRASYRTWSAKYDRQHA